MFTRRVYYRHGESSMEFFCFQKPFSYSLLSNTDAATIREIGYRVPRVLFGTEKE